MDKKGMPRSEPAQIQPTSEMTLASAIRDKASSEQDAKAMITGAPGSSRKDLRMERPISQAYKMLDNDLARDNIENDLPDADLQDL